MKNDKSDDTSLFPIITKSVSDLINDEEGHIPRSKLVVLGSTILLMGLLMQMEVFAKHSSHSSHSSHGSHGSHGSHVSGDTHTNHASHGSHGSHGSHNNSLHGSHSSHSNSWHNSHGSHGNVAHNNVSHTSVGVGSSHSSGNTGALHSNGALDDLPGTSQIPVPEIPKQNVNAGALASFELDPGQTLDPKLDER